MFSSVPWTWLCFSLEVHLRLYRKLLSKTLESRERIRVALSLYAVYPRLRIVSRSQTNKFVSFLT